MTIEEVINQLDDLKGHCSDFADKEDEESIWSKDIEALKIAVRLLEKEVPKKPKKIEKYKDKYWTTKGICPNCENIIGHYLGDNYCMLCGQRIDWSDVE